MMLYVGMGQFALPPWFSHVSLVVMGVHLTEYFVGQMTQNRVEPQLSKICGYESITKHIRDRVKIYNEKRRWMHLVIYHK